MTEAMDTIYKYPLQITDVQRVLMPSGAKILCAQVQGDQVCLWAEVDTEKETEPRIIMIVGTGDPWRSDYYTYIGTVQLQGYVWHVYEAGL